MTKKRYYPEVDQNLDMVEVDKNILEYWENNKIFEQSIKNRENSKNYVFYDGPPFASGLPHYGHLLASYTKDIFARYHTMLGKKVDRMFGWDCHGLPAEMGVEKETGISGRKAIEDYGIDKFNELCRKSVQKYVSEWKYYINRMGRWVDFDNGYKTMDLKYMESTIWVFKQLYDKSLLYEDYRVMPYSWTCQTPLSNFETKQDNSYRKKEDKAVTVKFKLKDTFKGFNSVSVLAWTTTPWTLPSNLALTINKDITYILIKTEKDYLILSKNSLQKYKKEIQGEVLEEFKGNVLLGLYYEPLFDYLLTLKEVKDCKNCFSILEADYVTDIDGTGVVHTASGFGEDDNITCKKAGIPTVCPIDDGGKFIEPVRDFIGMQVFETNEPIIVKMKEEGKWLKTEQYIHDYLHCLRTDVPLIYRALPSWYVRVESIKDLLIKNNENINWIPNHIKNGRFGKWLEGVKDWSITRNRFWGCPVPVWKSSNPKYPRIDVYGSIEELERDFNTKITDLHRPYIDNLTRPNPDDPTGESKMIRVTDVLDCWFESGSMPYGQHHYPFENKEWFEEHFPADFITEGDGQLRGWFYVLHVIGVALLKKATFKNCISYGVIVDETGKKLSKRLRNYTDPMEICNTHGSDSLRWFMMKSPVLKGEEIRIEKTGKDIKDTLRMSIKPVINTYNFFCMYANSDGIEAENLLEKKIFIVKKGQDNDLINDVLKIRREVFIKEQNINPEHVIDGHDFDIDKTHYVLYKDNQPISSITIEQTDKDILKVHWFSVLKEYRKNGIGSDLIRFVIEDCFSKYKNIELDAQYHLKDFYEKIGFIAVGEKFFDCDMELIKMKLNIESLEKHKYNFKNNLVNNIMDIYILSKMKITIKNIKKAMDEYSPNLACKESENFYEILNNWYIRRNKDRFWKSEVDADKITAYNTLYTVIINMSKVLAPLLPFTTEFIWRGITNNK